MTFTFKTNTDRVYEIPLDLAVVDPILNVRDTDVKKWALPRIVESIRLEGQKDEGLFLALPDGRFSPLRANRRTLALQILAARGEIDPRTVKRDDAGNVIPGTGKPFSTVRGRIVSGLSDYEQLRLRNDDQEKLLLDKVGVFRLFCKAREVGIESNDFILQNVSALTAALKNGGSPSKAVVKAERALEIAENESPRNNAKIENARKEYRRVLRDSFNTQIKCFTAANKLPFVAQEEYIKMLRKEQTWPNDRTVPGLVAAHEEDLKADPMVSKDRPGPKFTAMWNALLADVRQAEAEQGEGAKPRQQSMLSAKQIEETGKEITSPLLKVILLCVRNVCPAQGLRVLDGAIGALVKSASPEAQKALDDVLNAVLATKRPAEPAAEPAAEPTTEPTTETAAETAAA